MITDFREFLEKNRLKIRKLIFNQMRIFKGIGNLMILQE